MHFRKCVAIVVREYVAQERILPVDAVTSEHIVTFIDALNGSYIDFIQCIYYALCGKEAEDQSAVKTVGWWLAHPNTLTNTLYGQKVRVKLLGGPDDRYPPYTLQASWVRRNTQ